MTTFEIRTRGGKVRTIHTVQTDIDAEDRTRALRVLEDYCEDQHLDISVHTIRAWSQRRGWVNHGSTS